MQACFLNFHIRSKRSVISILCSTLFLVFGNFIAAKAQTITSFSPNPICQGDVITIKGTDFTGATSVKLGTVNATNFTVVDSATITATVDLASKDGTVGVTTHAGTASVSGLIVKAAPIPVLTDIGARDIPFTSCDGTLPYQLKVSNNSTNLPTGSNNYEIDWGDGTPIFAQLDWSTAGVGKTNHTYTTAGFFTITFTITPADGCKKTVTYQFYSGKNSLASFSTTLPTTGLCVPADIEFQIGNWFNNPLGTSYLVNFGDGSPNVNLKHPLNSTNTIQLLTHQYISSSCPNPQFIATLQTISGLCVTSYTLNQIVIKKKPDANFTTQPIPPCISGPVCFTNTTTDGYSGSDCSRVSDFIWNFGDGVTSADVTSPCHNYASAGTYHVTLIASNPSCGADTIEKQIIVFPTSPIPVVTSPVTYCKGQTAAQLTATGTGLLWYTAPTGGVGTSVAPIPSTAVAGSSTFYVSQTIPNNCESPRVPIVVTVYALPAAPTVTTPVQLCQNQTAVPLTAPGINLLWYTTPTGGAGSPIPPIPSTTTIGSITYYVSQSTINCEGPRAAIVVTVNPLAEAPVVVSPVTYCQNQSAVPLIATGTGLLWYTSATGGTGSSVRPTPSTAAVGTTTYYVSQVTGCGEGPRSSITVTINPGPSASIVYSNSNLCNVTGSSLVAVTLTGATGGNFSVTPTGLPVNATTGEINPSGATPGIYTIKYGLPASGGCSAFTTSTTVTINNTPFATIKYATPFCSSTSSANVQLTGVGGGTFTSTTGLTIDNSTGTITPSSSLPGPYVVTYTIAAAPPCPGFTVTSNVVITQAQSASINYNPVNICNAPDTGATGNHPIDAILAGTGGGTYSVIPASGLLVDAANGKITPAGATPGTYKINYTIKGTGGCADVIATASVTVNSAPVATIKYTSPFCTSGPTANVKLTGSAGGIYTSDAGLSIDASTGVITPAASTPGRYAVTYTIAASPPCPGLITTDSVIITQAPSAVISYTPSTLCNAPDTGSKRNSPITVLQTGTHDGRYSIKPSAGLPIDSMAGTITPAGALPGTYQIIYTIKGTGGCTDLTATTNVTVNSSPTATIKYAPPFCSSSTAATVQFAGVKGGTFTSSPGLTIDASTGTITPVTSTPGKYVVTYTIPESAPCPGYTTTDTVIITKAPAASIAYPTAICNVTDVPLTPNPPVQVVLTGTPGGSYTISPATGLPISTANGTLTPSNAVAGKYTITYSIPGAGGCPDYSSTTSVIVSAAPVATIVYRSSPYCRGINTPQPVVSTGNTGGVFTAGAGLSINSATGAINPAASAPGIYTVTYTIAPSSPCPGYITTTTVQIDDSPVLTFPAPAQTICSGGTAVYTPSSTVVNTTYAWSVTGALPANVAGISSGTATGSNPFISLSFTNTGAGSQTITVQVLPTNPSQNPCPGTPYNITLTVNPVPAAPLTDTANFCMGATPAALKVNPATGNTIKWYDKNLVLLSAAPVVSTASPAQFVYYVSQTNSFGCESPKSRIIAIVHPTAKIVSSSFSNPSTCGIPSGAVILNVLDLNNNPIPNIPLFVHYDKFGTSYQIYDSTDATGKITVPLVGGTYSGFYVETYGCLSQKIPDVFILKDPNPPAQPVAGYNPPICSETPLNLTALTPTSTQSGPISYVWAGPAFGALADTTSNTVITFPSASIADDGTYVVYAIQNNCISPTATFQVTIKQSPSKPIISTRQPLCIGDDLVLQAYSSIGGQSTGLAYVWKGPGTGFPVSAANAGISKVKIQDAGIYTITVNAPQTGCSSSTDTLIKIGDYPIVKFANDTLTLPTGYLLNLAPVITNAASPGVLPMKKFEWTPSQDLTCNDSICSSPVALIKNNTCYTLKATNIYGCSGSAVTCVKVFCQSSQIFIPNAFTPTGNVPGNDKLMVRASGISAVRSFRIFNRWGRVLFEKNNFPPNSPSFGWDGRVNGKLADPGVYIYTVEVVCENGIPYSFKGNVTLL